ncbi:MAG: MMPL family transporter [Clostridia bacterium]|nr:MMPL family transporter [Clostridia bacterium]
MASLKNWFENIKEKTQNNQALPKFSSWIVNHKVIVISIFAVLMILAVVGNFFVKKESDVISYLDNDTVTKQGLATLQEEFNIIGDFSMGISYVSLDQAKAIVRDIEKENEKLDKDGQPSLRINKMVWIGTFDSLDSLKNVGQGLRPSLSDDDIDAIKESLGKKFIISTEYNGTNVDTYIISVYFTTPNSADETANAIGVMENIVRTRLQEYINTGACDAPSVDAAYSFTGSAQNSKSLLESSVGDMPKFVIIAVVAVFVILLLTTKSYLEPLIFLATLGISILLNMGTNIIAGKPVGTVSSITASCATILQLAVAMDYAIFLMHTYYEELRTTPDPKQAMIQALPKTIKSVVASSLTTVGGFIALFFMKFGIGYDLGFVLAKGVILSLITVICLQPVIILFFSKWIAKSEHKWKPLTPRLKFDSKVITKKGVCIPIIVICIGLLIPAAMFQNKVDLTFISVTAENPNPNVAEVALESSSNQVIVMTPYILDDNDPQYEFVQKAYTIGYTKATAFDANAKYYVQDDTTYKMNEIAVTGDTFVENKYYVRDESCNTISDVFSISTLLNEDQLHELINLTGFVKTQVYSQLMRNFISNVFDATQKPSTPTAGKDKSIHYLLYTMTIVGEKEDVHSFNTVSAIQVAAESTFDGEAYTDAQLKMTGNVVAAKELSEVTPNDYKLVNILSVVIIFLILLFTFRSFFLSVILVMVIETGIWINLSISYFFHQQLHFMAYLIVSAIALGATVDYAILLTSKYQEEKVNGATGQAAIRNAIYRAAPGVLTSGSIFFVACLAVELVSTNVIVQQITQLLARNAVFSAVLVFSFLPSILSMKERIYKGIMIKMGKGNPDEGKSNESIYAVSSKDLEKFKASHPEAVEVAVENALGGEDVVIDAQVETEVKDEVVDEKKDN